MPRLVLYALYLLGAAYICNASFSCTTADSSHYSCTRDVILAIDATSNMVTKDNIRAEFDFIENWILPRLDIRKGFVDVGVTAYGTGSTTIYDFNYNRQQICDNMEKLWNNVDIDSASNVPLSRTIRNLFNNFGFDYTSLVLFTGDREQADVDAAGAQVEFYIENRLALNFSVVVVNYGNCSFNSWPQMHTNTYDAKTINVDQLSNYVDDSICTPSDPSSTPLPTIPEHLTTTANIQPTPEPTPTVPSLPVANINNTGCNCVLKTVWLDVFLLMEATTAMTPAGITSATDYVVSAFTKVTVGQAEQYQTRFGVIRYASSVDLIADLNVYTSTADLFDLSISSLNETGTNIEGSGGYNDPTQAANEFREDGGTIITIEYAQEHGLAVPLLRTLASPNYNLTNKKDDGTMLRADDLRNLLCEANCFCRTNWKPYNADKWDAPQGGCYFPVGISAIQMLANRTCYRERDAVLALDEDANKNFFLLSVFSSKTKFWLGLEYDGSQWTWPGGYSAGYTNWGPGQPDYSKGNCAYMQQYSGFSTRCQCSSLLLGTAYICDGSFSCYSDDNSHYSCSRHVILAIDATQDMVTKDNIHAEFDFIENWMLPQLDLRDGFVYVGMTAYGTRSTTVYDYNYNRRRLCLNVEEIWNSVDIDSASNVSLSTDQADVDAAGAQLEYYIENRLALNFSVVVVNYGNCSFSSWPQMHTNAYDANTIDLDKLSNYVDESICDLSGPSTPLSTIPEQQTTTANIKPTPEPTPTVPSLPVANINNTGCNCVLKTVWLDVFLLMEATTAMTPAGITSATDYVVSAFTKLTVGQAEQYQTRFGVIRYASSVDLIADLNFYNSTADLFDLTISSLNETGTNIEGSGGYNDPTQAASAFREYGGTIITIDYVQEHGLAVPLLRTLASPNYNLTNKKDDGTMLQADELRRLLCEANCFCRTNWMPYNADKWDAPQGGCYFPVGISSIQMLANRTCLRDKGAVLALDEDASKNFFLLSAFSSKTKFWLGLEYDGSQWAWSGGYSTGYTNWGPGQPDYSKGDCAYMQQYSGFSSGWFSDDCNNDHNYICQTRPCDSTNYCAAE
ncbi:unnamed protein product [Haemonchus placei]|uniref:VWFA domain-containing protein n=1 Tax=Haemonchus placei TaxID=6290 RepID=A0A0N4W7R3_HAEPC|nr:unnamed protein product [Haemonchus placei]